VEVRGRPVLMVDWLGRGGIAHTTETWYRELERAGREAVVATRSGRELAAAIAGSVSVGESFGPLAAHARLVRAARRLVEARPPSAVVLHGTVVPQLEMALVRATRRAGARTVLVAHEAHIARPYPFARRGLVRLLREVDTLVAHSRFVESLLVDVAGRHADYVLPLPVPLGLVSADGVPAVTGSPVVDRGEALLGLHFGHLHRGYKGAATVVELARRGAPGWRLALVGKGAPSDAGPAVCVDRFLDAGDLVATVAGSDAVLLPYETASQSAAVVLAQALGSAVVASAVGGIPEQVEDGRTGLLVPAARPAEAWAVALASLRDDGLRLGLAARAREHVAAAHRTFVDGMLRLLD
jgi:glycosyltransferase involved in cell wall biosynthesis